jgi:hypothetical protein
MPAAVKSVSATSKSVFELIRNKTIESYTHKVRLKKVYENETTN